MTLQKIREKKCKNPESFVYSRLVQLVQWLYRVLAPDPRWHHRFLQEYRQLSFHKFQVLQIYTDDQYCISLGQYEIFYIYVTDRLEILPVENIKSKYISISIRNI